MNLWELLDQLPELTADDSEDVGFIVLPVPSLPQHRIGFDRSRLPVLLLHTVVDDNGGHRHPPVRLEHLLVQHEVACRLRAPDGGVESGVFTVIQLQGGPTHLREHFIDVAQTLLARLGPHPTRSFVYEAVQGMVDLFRALSKPPRKSAQGLWAELLLIAVGSRPDLLAVAWHSTPEERYDFQRLDQRLEVKSASGRLRRHRFTLAQLDPPGNSQVLIASVLMEPTSGGVSMRELLNLCRKRLCGFPDLLYKLDTVVASTLGNEMLGSLDLSFDWHLAVSGLAFYRAEDVPSIAMPLNPAISEVSFVADLSSVSSVSVPTLKNALFRAAAPLDTVWSE